MQYRTYRPGPPLADFVEYLWALHDAPARPTGGGWPRACGYFDQSHLIHDVTEFTGHVAEAAGPGERAHP